MATPGMVCSLPAGPLGPSEGPPPWEHQGSCSPRPEAGREGKGGRGTDKREGCRKPGEAADGEKAMLWLLPPFLYPGVSIQAAAKAIALSQGSHERLLVPSESICLSGPACLCYNHCNFWGKRALSSPSCSPPAILEVTEEQMSIFYQ